MKLKWYQLKERLLASAFIPKILQWSKRVSLPGFYGISIYEVVEFVSGELKKDDILTRANSVAFSFFLSIFPLVIVIIPLLAITPLVASLLNQAEASISEVLPSNAKNYFLEMINGIRTEGHFGLRSISFLFAIIFSSSGMITLMFGFDKSYATSFKYRGYFKRRLVATLLTGLLAVIVVISFGLLIGGQFILRKVETWLNLSGSNALLFSLFNWTVIFFLFYSVITVIYRYGPSIYRPLKLINPGATLATISSILASLGFSFFINNFGRYNELYGSIGALIVFMLWLQINAFILLAGFELNAGIIVKRDIKILSQNDPMSERS